MRSPIVALALLAATTVSARQAPFAKPIVRAKSATDVQSSKLALDVTSVLADVSSRNIAIRGGDDDSSLSLMARLKIGGYFALWYMLNVIYNSELCADFCDIIANICHSLYHRYSSQPHLQIMNFFSPQQEISQCHLCTTHSGITPIPRRITLLHHPMDYQTSCSTHPHL